MALHRRSYSESIIVRYDEDSSIPLQPSSAVDDQNVHPTGAIRTKNLGIGRKRGTIYSDARLTNGGSSSKCKFRKLPYVIPLRDITHFYSKGGLDETEKPSAVHRNEVGDMSESPLTGELAFSPENTDTQLMGTDQSEPEPRNSEPVETLTHKLTRLSHQNQSALA
ncbi:hypothetical protein TWF281_007844 [Arthrobotrys megalospora]